MAHENVSTYEMTNGFGPKASVVSNPVTVVKAIWEKLRSSGKRVGVCPVRLYAGRSINRHMQWICVPMVTQHRMHFDRRGLPR
jgi:hypothetical protein